MALRLNSSTPARAQCRAVHGIDVLVGVHGAGLAWQLCLRPRSAVVVIGPYPDTLYTSIANGLGHTVALVADPLPSPAAVWQRVRTAIRDWQALQS